LTAYAALSLEIFVISHSRLEKGNGAVGLLIRLDLGESYAGVIVDADMDELPADAAAVALANPIAGDAMADPIETTELFDIDVDHLARCGALIAARRLGRLQVAYPVQTQPPQDAADGGRRDAGFRGNLLAGVALTAQGLDPQTYHGRVAANAVKVADSDVACFGAMDFPASCTWLDSQAHIEDTLGVVNIVATNVTVCSPLVFYAGKAISGR